MTGAQIVLGALGGAALGIAITALRLVVVRRVCPPTSVPASAEVLEAERSRLNRRPLTNRRTR